MKKIAVSIITCLVCVGSAQAATSALTESILEYEAITNALGTNPEFENVIPATEFIIDIKRITPVVNSLGIVRYSILTNVPVNDVDSHHHHDKHTHTYIATLNVTPNPGVGPNIVTVVNIQQVTDTDSD